MVQDVVSQSVAMEIHHSLLQVVLLLMLVFGFFAVVVNWPLCQSLTVTRSEQQA